MKRKNIRLKKTPRFHPIFERSVISAASIKGGGLHHFVFVNLVNP